MKKEKLLMTPGPTMVPPQVLEVLRRQMIHHRTKEFIDIFSEFNQNLKYVFKTQNHVLTFASSGTGAMESAVANMFSTSDKVLIATMGVFGDRLVKSAKAYGLECEVISVPWGTAVTPEMIKQKLEQDCQIKAVMLTHNETSTGVMNNIKEIAKIVAKTDKLFIVDAISSLGSIDIQTDEWAIDIVIGASQKGMMTPPGLSFVSVSEKAWQAHKVSKLPKFYFDYTNYRKKLEEQSPDTPYTPAVSLVLAQNEAIKLLIEEGLQNVFDRHQKLAKACRIGVKALGLELFADEEAASNCITSAKAPENIDIEKVRKIMNNKYDIMVTGGQLHLQGKIIRLGHCGFVDAFDLIKMFAALEGGLKECGFEFEIGKGLAAVEKELLLNN